MSMVHDLKSCCTTKDIDWGRRIHAKALENGDESNIYVQTTLIKMYAKCGSMVYAHSVFDSIQNPNVVCWNVLLLGYAENGEGIVSLQLFSRLNRSGCVPTPVTYVAALKACASLAVNGDGSKKGHCLQLGRHIHFEIRCNLNYYLQNTLIEMYAKCGSMPEALRVFSSVQNPDVISWNTLLFGYVDNGEGIPCLELFSRMNAHGCEPTSITYVAVLKACTTLAGSYGGEIYLKRAREIHSEIGCHLDRYLQSTLINMYGKFGSMVDSRGVFDSIQNPDVVSWNALLLGYVENGQGVITLDLFSRMKLTGCLPDSVTYIAAVKACTSMTGNGGNLEQGRRIHAEIGCHMDNHLQNTLIDMYGKCGSMIEARHVFDNIQNPNVVSWTALLAGYADNGEGYVALDLFSRQKASGCAPNSLTYVAVLKACGLVGALSLGRNFHTEIHDISAHVLTCLVDFYSKCGSMVEAREVFDLHSSLRSIPIWNSLIAGYSSFGDGDSTFERFEALEDEGFKPDAVTFMCMLVCCSHSGLVEKAREYFKTMEVKYNVTRSVMHYSCMVDILGRANKLDEATSMLCKMPCNPNAVTWRSLLCACCKWNNVEIGRMAFQSLVGMDKKNAYAHVLIAHIYGSSRQQSEIAQNIGIWKLRGQAYVMDVGKMVNFHMRNKPSFTTYNPGLEPQQFLQVHLADL